MKKLKIDRQLRVGIVGGMGPMATVLFQQLLIEATPAQKDQDHLQVLCFNNPKIPDRTNSLLSDDGKSYVHELVKTARQLEKAGANILTIPCITAHARWDSISRQLKVPLISMIDATVGELLVKKISRAALLCTDGTREQNVFLKGSESKKINWLLPSDVDQAGIMKAIYETKAGQLSLSGRRKLLSVANKMLSNLQ